MPIDPTDLAKSIGALGSLDPNGAWPHLAAGVRRSQAAVWGRRGRA